MSLRTAGGSPQGGLSRWEGSGRWGAGIWTGSECVNGAQGRAHGGRVCPGPAPFWGTEAEGGSPALSSCEEEQRPTPERGPAPSAQTPARPPVSLNPGAPPHTVQHGLLRPAKGWTGRVPLGDTAPGSPWGSLPQRRPPPWERAPGGRPCSLNREQGQLVTGPSRQGGGDGPGAGAVPGGGGAEGSRALGTSPSPVSASLESVRYSPSAKVCASACEVGGPGQTASGPDFPACAPRAGLGGRRQTPG